LVGDTGKGVRGNALSSVSGYWRPPLRSWAQTPTTGSCLRGSSRSLARWCS